MTVGGTGESRGHGRHIVGIRKSKTMSKKIEYNQDIRYYLNKKGKSDL